MSEIAKNLVEASAYMGGAYAAIATIGKLAAVNARAQSFKYPSEAALSFGREHVDQLRYYADLTTEYIRNERVGSVALLDTASRPFYIPLIHAWNQKYDRKTDPRPPIFFLNPQGFRSQEYTGGALEWATPIKALLKGGRAELPGKRRDVDTIINSFAQEQPGLYKRRDKSVLVIDSCLHTGNSAAHVLAGLNTVGFEDVRLMVGHFEPVTTSPYCVPDVIIDDQAPIGGCYPFGIDVLVRKTYGSSESIATQNEKQRQLARQLRANLHAAITQPNPVSLRREY